jgi:hypothetical protein
MNDAPAAALKLEILKDCGALKSTDLSTSLPGLTRQSMMKRSG